MVVYNQTFYGTDMNQSSIKNNFLYQMSYQVLAMILPLITSPYIARVIDVAGVGTYSYSYSIAQYFVLFSMAGVKLYGNRAIAQCRFEKEKLNKTFSEILFLHIFISCLCCIVYIGYIVCLQQDRLYAVIQMAYVLSALFDISWFYFGIEQFKVTSVRNIIVKILTVICIFVFVDAECDLWKYCAIMAIGTLVSQLMLWLTLSNYVKIVRPKIADMMVHLKPMLVLFLPSIAISLYKYMDKIMLGELSGRVQLGYYENAEKVISIPSEIIAAFGAVMLPKMSNLAVSDNIKQTAYYIEKSMRYVMCLALGLSFGLGSIGDVFAPVFWGENFYFAGKIIKGLAVTIPFVSFANIIRTQYLIPRVKDNVFLISIVLGAIANLIMNVTLIPYIGSMGATIGTIVAEATVCLAQCYAVRKELEIVKYLKNLTPFVVIGIVMFAGVCIMGEAFGTSIQTLIIQILSGGVFYCVMSGVYLYLTKEEYFMNSVSEIINKIYKKGK